MKAGDWIADSRMNLLVDYYTEVSFRPYGSGSTRANTLPWLKKLKLGYICIYAKGHSGYTTWHSSLDTAHAQLAKDMPAFFRKITREADTKLVLYYSGLLDGVAGERHPDWRMHNLDGSDRRLFDDFKNFHAYGICPQSGYFDEWVAVHLREMITGYDPDGIWVDGDWPGPCYCPRCQKRFREETGWTGSWDKIKKRPNFPAAYGAVWMRIEHEWRMRFNGLVKSLKSDCVYSAGNVSARREFLAPFDWRSGDFFLPGNFHLRDIAKMMCWYSTLGVPYDAYVCDTSFTHVRKHVRSRTKTLDRMMQESAVVAADGGAVGYWTFPLGNGALVPSRMKKAVAVREFLAEREDVFVRTEAFPLTAIVNTDPAAGTFCSTDRSVAHKAMAALHRSPVLMDETDVSATMPYDLVVLPEQPVVSAATARALSDYVQRGGRLLTTGASIQSREIRRLVGVAKVTPAAVNDGHVRLKSSSEPVGIDLAWDKLARRGSRELYPLFLSWDQFNKKADLLPNNWPMHGQMDEEHPEPAGFPAAIVRKVGKGTVVHIATGVFAHYGTYGDPQVLAWLREIVAFLDPKPLLSTTAPSWVNVSLRKKGGRLLVHFVNLNPGRDVAKLGTDDVWVDEIPEIGPFQLELRMKKKPAAVFWEPGHVPLAGVHKAGVLRVEIPRFKIHGCVVICDEPARK